jgi:DNA-directed RNA polymerase specialized sigma24 family protein
MVYYENVGSSTLAERLGVTLGTLRVRKHRVLARLAELLKAQEA